MSKIDMCDAFVIDGVRKTADGYLTAFASVARTGVQVYQGFELGRPDLGEVRVYRPAEEVFSADALRSFAHRPVTLKHPPRPVNAANWKKYAGGQTGDDVVRDGEFVRVPMVMMDAALIDAYEKQGIKELSMGYSTDIQWRAGVTDAGESYDAVQTAIRGNHLALVPVARGGDQLRVGDHSFKDSSQVDDGKCPECGAEMQGDECPECNYIKDGEPKMKVLVIDGLNVTVADDQSASIIQRVLDGFVKKLADADAELEAKKKKDAELDKELGDAKATVSAKDGEIAVLKKQIADAEVTPAKLDVMVKDRMSVIDAAAKLLPKDFAFDGKTLADIRKAAVEVKLGDAAKSMDDAAIGGAFAALCSTDKGDGGSRPIADAFAARRGGTSNDVRDAAYEASCATLSNNWRGTTAA